jgi:hypothetical protein
MREGCRSSTLSTCMTLERAGVVDVVIRPRWTSHLEILLPIHPHKDAKIAAPMLIGSRLSTRLIRPSSSFVTARHQLPTRIVQTMSSSTLAPEPGKETGVSLTLSHINYYSLTDRSVGLDVGSPPRSSSNPKARPGPTNSTVPKRSTRSTRPSYGPWRTRSRSGRKIPSVKSYSEWETVGPSVLEVMLKVRAIRDMPSSSLAIYRSQLVPLTSPQQQP